VKNRREDELIAEYNKALAAFKRTPRGDPRHTRLSDKLIAAQRALKRYRKTRDQD